MKGIALMALFGVGALAIWKHHVAATAVKAPQNDLLNARGVSLYPPIPTPQLRQQLLAYLPTNPNAVSEPGYSPAFGENENQPGSDEVLY